MNPLIDTVLHGSPAIEFLDHGGKLALEFLGPPEASETLLSSWQAIIIII